MMTLQSQHATLWRSGFVAALVLVGAGAAAGQERFRGMDRNGDGVITRDEWRGNAQAFARHDRNGDGILSGDELQDDRSDWSRTRRFDALDVNHDGRISRQEWQQTADTFDWLDRNGDGQLTRAELLGEAETEPPANLFDSLDTDNNGRVTRDEWRWSRRSFEMRDVNGDGALSPAELNQAAASEQSQAYRVGHERGLRDGRQAGREDASRQHWDLEGQRELEQADAGFSADLGPRADYQAGYRAGFIDGYRQGFGPRR
jgi:Ca2+-binding EF-hand superfamily protein